MSSKRKKMLYIRAGTVPLPNFIFEELLPEKFPEFDLHMIDLVDFIKQEKLMSLSNLPFIFSENGLKSLFSKKTRKTAFIRTTHFFHSLKRYLETNIDASEYAFSLQQQSLFDASVSGLPHFIYTDHTYLVNLTYDDFDASELPPKEWLELEKQIYANANITFTWSNHVRQSLIDQYDCPPDRVARVGVGAVAVPQENQLDNDNYRNKNIIFVGIDWERKDGPNLIKAFKEVLKHHPDATLTIVGASPEVDVPNCEIVGKIPPDEVSQYMNRATVFCMPSKVEPFGIVFVEAMLHRLPVIATNIGALPDFLKHGENGYLIEPGDVEHLTHYLIELLDDPERSRRFGEAGYRIAIENYTWDTVGDKIRSHIERIVEIPS